MQQSLLPYYTHYDIDYVIHFVKYKLYLYRYYNKLIKY